MAKKMKRKKAKSATKQAPKTERAAASKKPESAPETAVAPAPKSAASPRPRDPRLPPAGTVLQKKDRQGDVRCECTVEEDGICYAGKTYRSLSAAAMAASKDLGLGGRAQNGFLFWGLVKQPARAGDPVAALAKAWARYRGRAQSLAAGSVTSEAREGLRAELKKHAEALADLARAV